MKKILLLLIVGSFLGCKSADTPANDNDLNKLAEQYVRLGLEIGQYDPDFVDAYYGPDSLKSDSKLDSFPKDSLLAKVERLQTGLNPFTSSGPDSVKVRAAWISRQLKAFGRRIRIFSGEYASFDQESEELFGVRAPSYNAAHFQKIIDSLDKILPGQGSIQQKFQTLANRFIIPKDKLDTIFKRSIAEARARTLRYYELPAGESFTLEYVTNKSWSGYNWYKGNYTSLIQINTDTQIFLERAIDVGSHESYPGHHVYNMLLEKNLYREKGWIEISLYPLFSPQSFIAEGSANYGIELAFPGDEKILFARETLLPLAGLDTNEIALYFKALSLKGKLNYARNEAARGLINNTMDEKQASDWLQKYCLFNEETALKSVEFIKKYRSYVINYNYGQDLVKQHVEGGSADPQTRWKHFEKLLSEPVNPSDLLNPESAKN